MGLDYELILPEGVAHPEGIPECAICGFQQRTGEYKKELLEAHIYAGEGKDPSADNPWRQEVAGTRVTRKTAYFRSRRYSSFTGELLGIWINPSSVVTVTSDKPDEIIIQPYSPKKVDWDKLWKMIKKSRSIKGKRGNLSEFIVQDRYRH